MVLVIDAVDVVVAAAVAVDDVMKHGSSEE